MARFRSQENQARGGDVAAPQVGVSIPVSAVSIDLPIGDPAAGHAPHHISVQLFTADARAGAARLLDGLRKAGAARRDTGRVVDSMADAVRYLLEIYERAAMAAE